MRAAIQLYIISDVTSDVGWPPCYNINSRLYFQDQGRLYRKNTYELVYYLGKCINDYRLNYFNRDCLQTVCS